MSIELWTELDSSGADPNHQGGGYVDTVPGEEAWREMRRISVQIITPKQVCRN